MADGGMWIQEKRQALGWATNCYYELGGLKKSWSVRGNAYVRGVERQGDVTEVWQGTLGPQKVRDLDGHGEVTQGELYKGKRQSSGLDLEHAHTMLRHSWRDA